VAAFLILALSTAVACGGGDSSLDAFIARTQEPTAQTDLPTRAPAAAQPSATPQGTTEVAGAREYVVQEGDSLGAIAAEFGVTVDAIVQANDIADPNLITVGQALQIPPAE
jgi:LysM repeat protein